MEGKWKETKYWFRRENDKRPPLQRAGYDPALESQGSDEAAIKNAVYVLRRYFQLESGHALTSSYLQRIERSKTGRCWECTT